VHARQPSAAALSSAQPQHKKTSHAELELAEERPLKKARAGSPKSAEADEGLAGLLGGYGSDTDDEQGD
jgi:hypothetical protein